MRILAFGDIHDQLRPLPEIFTFADKMGISCVLITGDFGAEDHSVRFVSDLLGKYGWRGIAVYGNHEPKMVISSKDRGLRVGCLRILRLGEVIEYRDLRILGVCGNRGSGKKWSHWRDSQILKILDELSDQKIDIILAHEMPLGLADICRGTKSCGQQVLRILVERLRPKLYIGGHLHTIPQYAQHNNTLVLKIGGISNRGALGSVSFFSIIDMDNMGITAHSYKYTMGKIERIWTVKTTSTQES